MIRSTPRAVTAVALLALLATAGCGSRLDDADQADAPEPAASSVASAGSTSGDASSGDDETPAGGEPAGPDQPGSGGDDDSGAQTPDEPAQTDPDDAGVQWVERLDALVAPGESSEAKAAQVVGGEDLAGTIDQLMRQIAGADLAFEVAQPVVNESAGRGNVTISADGDRVGTIPASFTVDDGAWHLDRAGACSLVSLAGLRCPAP